jgi:hypothetical protein
MNVRLGSETTKQSSDSNIPNSKGDRRAEIQLNRSLNIDAPRDDILN